MPTHGLAEPQGGGFTTWVFEVSGGRRQRPDGDHLAEGRSSRAFGLSVTPTATSTVGRTPTKFEDPKYLGGS